jgi:hypothetical protein
MQFTAIYLIILLEFQLLILKTNLNIRGNFLLSFKLTAFYLVNFGWLEFASNFLAYF